MPGRTPGLPLMQCISPSNLSKDDLNESPVGLALLRWLERKNTTQNLTQVGGS